MKQTQRQRLLQTFQEKGELFVYEMMAPQPMGLGIAQYNARILELRRLGYSIINDQPGHFVYQKNQIKEGEVISIPELEKKLEKLRMEYVNATTKADRNLIERRGLAIKTALEMAEKDEHVKNVVEALYD